MQRDERWDSLTDDSWRKFALAWDAELSGKESAPLPDLPQLFEDEPTELATEFVIVMNFFSSPESQWKFILAAFECCSDETLGHLAAGPVEHILGNYGELYIDKIESCAKEDARFVKMLKGCYQYQMSNEVWRRVCLARSEDA